VLRVHAQGLVLSVVVIDKGLADTNDKRRLNTFAQSLLHNQLHSSGQETGLNGLEDVAIPQRIHNVADHKQGISVFALISNLGALSSRNTALNKCERVRKILDKDAVVTPLSSISAQQIVVSLITMNALKNGLLMKSRKLLTEAAFVTCLVNSSSKAFNSKLLPFVTQEVILLLMAKRSCHSIFVTF
jgi:hypothetical protein